MKDEPIFNVIVNGLIVRTGGLSVVRTALATHAIFSDDSSGVSDTVALLRSQVERQVGRAARLAAGERFEAWPGIEVELALAAAAGEAKAEGRGG